MAAGFIGAPGIPHTCPLLPLLLLLFLLPAPESQILAVSPCAKGPVWLCNVCG